MSCKVPHLPCLAHVCIWFCQHSSLLYAEVKHSHYDQALVCPSARLRSADSLCMAHTILVFTREEALESEGWCTERDFFSSVVHSCGVTNSQSSGCGEEWNLGCLLPEILSRWNGKISLSICRAAVQVPVQSSSMIMMLGYGIERTFKVWVGKLNWRHLICHSFFINCQCWWYCSSGLIGIISGRYSINIRRPGRLLF